MYFTKCSKENLPKKSTQKNLLIFFSSVKRELQKVLTTLLDTTKKNTPKKNSWRKKVTQQTIKTYFIFNLIKMFLLKFWPFPTWGLLTPHPCWLWICSKLRVFCAPSFFWQEKKIRTIRVIQGITAIRAIMAIRAIKAIFSL